MHISTNLNSFVPLPTPSYPSRCLQFLQPPDKPDTEPGLLPKVNQSKVPLKIIIVGGGLGGLATSIALARRGHVVIVLEQASQLGEVI